MRKMEPRRAAGIWAIGLFLLIFMGFRPGVAQSGGQGSLGGLIADQSGAVIPNAKITVTDVSTGTSTSRESSNGGVYLVAPLPPGKYTVTVQKAGFETARQENLTIAAMQATGLDFVLQVGSEQKLITVSAEPPALNTTSATIGETMSNETYSALPLSMGGLQRDPTAFVGLMNGVVPGSRIGSFSGTGTNLAELYLDGLPLTTPGQQGDNRNISLSVSIEAVDQFKVETSGISAEYQGAGLSNYVIKSGTNAFHGTVADFIRNTIFDTWGFTAPALTQPNAQGQLVPSPKPSEHQNELSISLGGPILHNKLFFFGAFDKFHYTSGVHPGLLTVPTLKMRNGDFSELLASNGGPGYPIYDPTTQAACTAHSTNGACRYQYGYGPSGSSGPGGGPVPNGSPINVVPQSQISPISQYMQKFLPTPSNSLLSNNYLGGVASGYANFEYDMRFDADLTSKQRLSFIFTNGHRHTIGYNLNSALNLPPPYINGQLVTIVSSIAALEHSYVITPRLVNQFKYGYAVIGGPPVANPSYGVDQYKATTAGITNLPAGLAGEAFPVVVFSGVNAPARWYSPNSYTAVNHTFVLKDNLLWQLGRHSVTIGGQVQWLQANQSAFDTQTSTLTLNYAQNETEAIQGGGFVANTGYSYASYIIGGVKSGYYTSQPFSVLGGRFLDYAPYVEDNIKVTPRLTLNLGLRWDFYTPYKEVLDRWSYLDPNGINPATGNNGILLFAGNRGPISCGCRTPVSTYLGHAGPRLGFAYSLTPKTVIRGSFGMLYSHGGGIGGLQTSFQGTGQLGFSLLPSASDSIDGPAFYLNNSAGYRDLNLGNTSFGGANYVAPIPGALTASSQLTSTGNYVGTGGYVAPSNGPGYVDPYLAKRAPSFNFYNFGVQRSLPGRLTVSVDYAGTQSHFLQATGARGYWSNQLDPRYLALGALLGSAATSANIAKAVAIIPGIKAPYPGYVTAAGKSSQASIAQMLIAFPQYSGNGIADIWGDVGNGNYNSLQVTVKKEPSHGISFALNYTYSKQIDDVGTFRSGFDIPSSVIVTGKAWKMDSIERSASTLSRPQAISIYGVYHIPAFNQSRMPDMFTKSWSVSGIYHYYSGTPLAITSSACVTPLQGQCMPNYNPNFSGSPRLNGSWGHGVTAKTLGSVSYVNKAAFQDVTGYLLGDLARTAPYGLTAPGYGETDISIRRTFPIYKEAAFTFQADVFNLLNHTEFGGINQNVDSTTFGTVSQQINSSRDWQFSGRIAF